MIENIKALSELINLGIALIPVNKLKEPFASFKLRKPNDYLGLLDAISFYERRIGEPVERVAARCGLVSGSLCGDGVGLVCLDIDSKHNEGFSKRFYSDVQTFFPELWDRFRIEETPSGGLHFWYFLGEVKDVAEVWSSRNLAARYSTQEELDLNPKKTKCFIELKAGDGSLATCFPSKGYLLLKDWVLPGGVAGSGQGVGVVGLDSHQELISLCTSYNEVIKEEVIKPIKSREGIYIEGKTPFDCFNISDLASDVLDDLGWKRWKKYGGLETFIKPGAKKNKVGATFNPEKRTYAILTTGSDIETKCYKASTLLCKEKFGGDAAACYTHLVSLGFGILKPNIEKNEIRKGLATGVLPANISKDGLAQYEIEKQLRNEKYPFGEFWDGDSAWSISREDLIRVSSNLGFRSYKEKPVYIDGYTIEIVDERFYYDYLKSYINQESNIELLNAYEDFLQKSGKFTISRLEKLDEKMILRSTKKESYKFYSNCYITITADDYVVCGYENFKNLIWKKDIKDRDFNFITDFKRGLYWDFIKNAIGWSQYLMKCIGFYAHDFRDEESYLCYTLEKCEDSKDGGGSGKNIFWKLFSLTTSFKSTAASMISKSNQFLQSWNGERVFIMSDLPKTFDLIFFKDMVTDGAVVRKLYANEYNVDVADMAKLGASGNYSFDDADPGIKRRLRIIEFSDYYTLRGGVKTAHGGKMFPKDWVYEDFLLFDNIIAMCIQEYLIGECIIEKVEISNTGWAKKQNENYKHLFDFIKQNIDNWVEIGKVSNKFFNQCYTDFRVENNILRSLSSFTINKALDEYCEHYKIPFLHSYKKANGERSDGMGWREGVVVVKGRFFGKEVEKFLSRNPDNEKVGNGGKDLGESGGSGGDDLPF